MYLKTEACVAHRQVGYFTEFIILPSIPGSDVMSQANLMRASIHNSCTGKASLLIAVASLETPLSLGQCPASELLEAPGSWVPRVSPLHFS